MSITDDTRKPPSLAQHFDAPEGYVGHFGWLCGYSADALFLDDVAERFTRLTHGRRAYQGQIALAIFLDPSNPQISVLDAPGVAHLPLRTDVSKPFRLLHAKVALLGFRHQEKREQWCLRLLVSTGNWTRQTLEESLDLAWRIDITSKTFGRKINISDTQACSDIEAAWELFEWISGVYDTRLLGATADEKVSQSMVNQKQVREWIEFCSAKANGATRYFDNRKSSLLQQIPKKVKELKEKRCNYLAMGSGFYEGVAEKQKAIPTLVPEMIVKTLKDANLLIKKPDVDVYVNPKACQVIATSAKALQMSGMVIRPAATPEYVFGKDVQRNLHAKFLFSAQLDKSNICFNAWIYLGSGNLTRPGFMNKMSANAGNLEAGVVFSTGKIYLCQDGKSRKYPVVTEMLPIQWDNQIDEAEILNAGAEIAMQNDIYIAPPVAWFKWVQSNKVHELHTEEDYTVDIQVLDSAGEPCKKTKGGFEWLEAQPRQVRIRWQVNSRWHEVLIPVVDQYGRIAATELHAIEIDEAWWQLADFPLLIDDDGADNKIHENGKLNRAQYGSASITSSSYPIRQIMELIENIAIKQTCIDERDWALWCNRIELTLCQACESAPVVYFRNELKVNPISPLRNPSFRPVFAENSDSDYGRLYDLVLTRIEKCWAVEKLDHIGDNQ